MIDKQKLLTILFAFLALALAIFIDDIVPQLVIVSSLYAVPILIIGYQFNEWFVGIVGAISIGAFTIDSLLERPADANLLFSVLGLGIVVFLSIQFVKQRKKANENAENAKNSQNQLQTFVNMVSHDLAQPVTVINLSLELLKTDRMLSKKGQIALKSLTNSSVRILRLINDLKDIAKFGGKNFEIKPKRFDLVSLIQNVVEQFKLQTNVHQFVIQSPKSVVGKWDRDRINQVFTNLISNAVKYSPKGGEIKIVVNKDKSIVTVSISDQGTGISKSSLRYLFKPYFRDSKHKGIQGTGLGLYITRNIVEAHKGKIWVESTLKKGSIFYVQLPLAKAN